MDAKKRKNEIPDLIKDEGHADRFHSSLEEYLRGVESENFQGKNRIDRVKEIIKERKKGEYSGDIVKKIFQVYWQETIHLPNYVHKFNAQLANIVPWLDSYRDGTKEDEDLPKRNLEFSRFRVIIKNEQTVSKIIHDTNKKILNVLSSDGLPDSQITQIQFIILIFQENISDPSIIEI
jgi:hypothetical protein